MEVQSTIEPVPHTPFKTLQGTLSEVIPPDSPQLLSLAPGWIAILALLAAYTAVKAIRLARTHRQNKYRRQALAILEERGPKGLPSILKATAMAAYPAEPVASLHGPQWLAFLDSRYDGPRFHTTTGAKLQVIAYQSAASWTSQDVEVKALMEMGADWIRNHNVEGT